MCWGKKQCSLFPLRWHQSLTLGLMISSHESQPQITDWASVLGFQHSGWNAGFTNYGFLIWLSSTSLPCKVGIMINYWRNWNHCYKAECLENLDRITWKISWLHQESGQRERESARMLSINIAVLIINNIYGVCTQCQCSEHFTWDNTTLQGRYFPF